MDVNADWCSFCDAIFRSGVWVASPDPVTAYRCPECSAGWNPVEGVTGRVSTSAG